MENSSQELFNAFKAARVRSVAYPSNTIEHCVGLTSDIFKIFGNVFATREAISKQLEISDSHLQTQLSSCVQYGLLELKSKEGYKQTPLFTKIYKPLQSERKEDALLEAFKNPELYKNIIREHDNQTLTATGLAIILFRNHRVSDNASTIAAKVFIDNAAALGLINEDNLFSVNNIVSIAEPLELSENIPSLNNTPKDDEVIYLPPNNIEQNINNNSKKYDFPPIPVFVDDDGNVAEIYLPKGFNRAHIERIIKVLTAQIS